MTRLRGQDRVRRGAHAQTRRLSHRYCGRLFSYCIYDLAPRGATRAERARLEGQFTYEDFDLLIEPGPPGSYRARVLRSPAGESAPVQFTLPFSPVELENFVLKVGQRRRRTRGGGRPESAPLKDFGGKLYGAVFHGEVRDRLQRSLSRTGARAWGCGCGCG